MSKEYKLGGEWMKSVTLEEILLDEIVVGKEGSVQSLGA